LLPQRERATVKVLSMAVGGSSVVEHREMDECVHVFGETHQPFEAKILPFLQRGASFGLTALSKLTGGRSLNLEPVVRLLGMRLFARRLYGALIDANGA